MNDKTEATRLADVLDDSLCPMCHQAAALLRRWPDGEPVGYLPAYELDRLQNGHDGRLRSAKFGSSALDGDIALYTATPDQSERIAELEARYSHAALRHVSLFGELQASLERVAELERERDALRSELDAVSAAIGTNRYMDPPDGGDVSLGEQVRRLRSEWDVQEAALANVRGDFRELAREVEGLRSELAEAQRDAERYRYLRDRAPGEVLELKGPAAGVWIDAENTAEELVLLTGEDADVAIDSAMQGKSA